MYVYVSGGFRNISFSENFADILMNNKKKLYGPFSWIVFNCFKATEPLRGESLLFTIQSPRFSGTHLIDLGRMKR